MFILYHMSEQTCLKFSLKRKEGSFHVFCFSLWVEEGSTEKRPVADDSPVEVVPLFDECGDVTDIIVHCISTEDVDDQEKVLGASFWKILLNYYLSEVLSAAVER